jgi:hypothetical protein
MHSIDERYRGKYGVEPADGRARIFEGAGWRKATWRKTDWLMRREAMIKFLLWCILLVMCWPLALLALVLYPLVWLLLLPFRVVGIAVDGALELVGAVVMLPVRVMRAI